MPPAANRSLFCRWAEPVACHTGGVRRGRAEALTADLRSGLRDRTVVLATHEPTQILLGDAVIDPLDPARLPVTVT